MMLMIHKNSDGDKRKFPDNTITYDNMNITKSALEKCRLNLDAPVNNTLGIIELEVGEIEFRPAL